VLPLGDPDFLYVMNVLTAFGPKNGIRVAPTRFDSDCLRQQIMRLVLDIGGDTRTVGKVYPKLPGLRNTDDHPTTREGVPLSGIVVISDWADHMVRQAIRRTLGPFGFHISCAQVAQQEAG
jgi:hypothetical protein